MDLPDSDWGDFSCRAGDSSSYLQYNNMALLSLNVLMLWGLFITWSVFYQMKYTYIVQPRSFILEGSGIIMNYVYS